MAARSALLFTLMGAWLERDGGVIIPTKLEPARAGAGAALVLVGIVIGSQVVSGVLASRASAGAAWAEYLPAVLVFGGIALAFIIPGAFMLLYKRFVRLDLATQEVSENQRYLGYHRIRTYPRAELKTIVLARRFIRRRLQSSGGGTRKGGSYPIFVVELKRTRDGDLNIMRDLKEAPAREVATKLAVMTGLPLRDVVARERSRDGVGE